MWNMNANSSIPPGFRFHPTDEELVGYYLRKKVTSRQIELDVIKDVDLYRIEPWDIQEKCRIGIEEQSEWYFYSHKDKKYPTGTRTNRATTTGFWKATGRDKPIYSKHNLIGMRKTLVFYKGRAPNGQKLDWIMHEYRLETNENGPPQEEGWVVCKVFKKRLVAIRNSSDNEPLCWFDERVPFMPELNSPKVFLNKSDMVCLHPPYLFKKELDSHYVMPLETFSQVPQLEGSKLLDYINHDCIIQSTTITQDEHLQHDDQLEEIHVSNNIVSVNEVKDWRAMDKFVASQLSHDNVCEESDYPNEDGSFHVHEEQEEDKGYALATTSCYEIDLWK